MELADIHEVCEGKDGLAQPVKTEPEPVEPEPQPLNPHRFDTLNPVESLSTVLDLDISDEEMLSDPTLHYSADSCLTNDV